MTSPLGQLVVEGRGERRVSVERSTRETRIRIVLGLDGSGESSIATGIGLAL